jgi:outer membrane protein TolC
VAADESDEVRQQESSARVALQRWTGTDAEELTQPALAVLPKEDAFAAAHPSVVALQRDIEVARRVAAVAASERRPNWTWELSYGQRTGYSDMVSFGVSIPLQVAPAQRQNRESAARMALVEKAEAELAEATRTAVAQYRTLMNDVERLQQRIERYRASVVTPAEQRSGAALAGYRSNQIPLMTLFEARHAGVETRRKLLSLQRELARAQAQLAFTPLSEGTAR